MYNVKLVVCVCIMFGQSPLEDSSAPQILHMDLDSRSPRQQITANILTPPACVHQNAISHQVFTQTNKSDWIPAQYWKKKNR